MNENLQELIHVALSAIAKLQSDQTEADSVFANGTPFPPTIPLQDGRVVLITRDGYDALCKFGLLWRKTSKSTESLITTTSAERWARECFGEALSDESITNCTTDSIALDVLINLLDKRVQGLTESITHYFPCHIFDDQSRIDCFAIGPVSFHSRLDWIAHVEKQADKALPWSNRVIKNWYPEEGMEEETDFDPIADTVSEATKICKWVAAISIPKTEYSRSHERASTTVRLALDAFGLGLERKGANCLRGPGDEIRSTDTYSLVQIPGQDIHWGFSTDLPVLGYKDSLKKYLASTEPFRNAAGQALTSFINPNSNLALPTLNQRWCDALFWFGEARRDKTSFMALVRYGMALDILAKGTRKKGIVNLLSALFNLKPNDIIIAADGSTLDKVIIKIYNEGRSQFGHGGRAGLLQDLPISVHVADQITTRALLAYVMCLQNYRGEDSEEKFLEEIPNLIPSTSDNKP
jgi:hypothetical protein